MFTSNKRSSQKCLLAVLCGDLYGILKTTPFDGCLTGIMQKPKGTEGKSTLLFPCLLLKVSQLNQSLLKSHADRH